MTPQTGKTQFEVTVTRCYPGPGLRSDEAVICAIGDTGLPVEFVGPAMTRGTKLTVTIEEADS